GLPPQAEVSYETFLNGIHPDDRGRVEGLIESVLDSRDEGDCRIEYRTMGPEDGRERWVTARGQAFFDEEGRPVRFVGTVGDTTERKKAEGEIRRLNEGLVRRAEELSRSNAELERFAYVASHDLQAPLRRIEGFAEALLEDYAGRLDAEGRDFLRRIVASVRRMERLVDGLLELSRVEGEEVRRERVDLRAVAGSVFEELRRSDPARRVKFAAEEDFGIVPVEAQAAGCPVIAYGKGGALETVTGWPEPDVTGVFFDAQTPESLEAAVRLFEAHEGKFGPEVCRRNADRFGAERFQHEFRTTMEDLWSRFQRGERLE
ncbi:MAG: PAS domain-containing protein, partial [Actinomycetota bacterium]|nr:PAS domain-containing protein [Actinomycetota bacterium]